MRNPYEEAKSADVQSGGSASPLFYSFLLSALVLAGFISVVRKKITLAEIAVVTSLGVTVLWPWETVRFVLPLIPFLTFYFLVGCALLYQAIQKLRKRETARASVAWAGGRGAEWMLVVNKPHCPIRGGTEDGHGEEACG